MPGILDRASQLVNELFTTKQFGEEIAEMQAADRADALADLLPELEKTVNRAALQQLNEKIRKWIDRHPQP